MHQDVLRRPYPRDFTHSLDVITPIDVIPAKAGIQCDAGSAPPHPLASPGRAWIPAFAGMTARGRDDGGGAE